MRARPRRGGEDDLADAELNDRVTGETLVGGNGSREEAASSGRAASAQVDGTVRAIELHPQLARRRGPGRGWLVRRMLVAADVVGLLLALGLTEFLYRNSDVPSGVGIPTEFIIFACTLPGWVVLAKLYGLYDRDDRRTDYSTADEFVPVLHMTTVVVWLYFATSKLTGLTNPDSNKLATFWLLATAAIVLGRATARTVARRRPGYIQRAVIVGAGDVGQLIARKLLQHPEYGIELLGFVDRAPKERRDDVGDLTVLGAPDDLARIVDELGVERVIVAFTGDPHEVVLDLLRSMKDLNVQIDIVPRLFEIIGPSLAINSIEGVPIVSVPRFRLSRSSRFLKREIDIAISSIALVLLAPLFVLIGVLIKLDSRGPVFFRQIRMGTGNRIFRIWKFRTMVVDAERRKSQLADLNKHARTDPRMFKVPEDPRVTRIGAFLRRYSLDELPQLINVLRGEMSLVGPRPLILDEDEHVGAWARRRLDLRPGMTGLWQVLGRNEIPFEEMVKLDYLYVTGWSLGGDLKLMARTIPSIFRARATY
jgi:exopolysaccharide biosynthesis polyprenyl glycosylphosphotransferase